MSDGCPSELFASEKTVKPDDPSVEPTLLGHSPFVYRFRTPTTKYVYDVNTRRILRVDAVVWDIIHDVGSLSHDELVAKYHAQYSPEELAIACNHIAEAQMKGLFLSNRPQRILSCDPEHVALKLRTERQQLLLNVTEACNFRCEYCIFGGPYSYFRGHSSKTMTWEVAKAAIDDFLSHSTAIARPALSFYGGEPLLAMPLIEKCVHYIRQLREPQSIYFSITTNGYLLSHEVGDFLAKNEFLIVVSLDGPEANHDQNRRTLNGEPTWQRIVGNLQRFLLDHQEYSTNGRIRFNSVATSKTDLRDIQEFFNSNDLFTDAMGLELSPLRPDGQGSVPADRDEPFYRSRDCLFKDYLESLKTGDFGREYGFKSRWVQSAGFNGRFAKFHKRGFLNCLPECVPMLVTCMPGVRRTFVTVDGDYYACERVELVPENVLGNVKTGTDELKVLDLVRQWNTLSEEQCCNCWCLSFCGPGCYASVSENGRLTKAAKDAACAAHRRGISRLLVDYCSVLEANANAFNFTADIEFY